MPEVWALHGKAHAQASHEHKEMQGSALDRVINVPGGTEYARVQHGYNLDRASPVDVRVRFFKVVETVGSQRPFQSMPLVLLSDEA